MKYFTPEMRKAPIVKGRKDYICELCGEVIKDGERHYSSGFASRRRHIECQDRKKYNIPLRDRPNKTRIGRNTRKVNICPVCKEIGFDEHIVNFGKCGKCKKEEVGLK